MDVAKLSRANVGIDQLVSSVGDMIRLIGEESSLPYTLHDGRQIVGGLGMSEDASMLQSRLNDIDQGLFTILVFGRFKNGKSTLINSILGDKFLPAHIVPTTAVITIVINGTRGDVAIYREHIKEPEYITREEFFGRYRLKVEDSARSDSMADRFRDIEYAQIETQHPICANRVRLVDSPGLGEHMHRTRAARSFLKGVQVVVYVLDATKILGEDEVEVIEGDLGEGRLDNVFFVINRINNVDEDQVDDLKDWVKRKLHHHFLDEQDRFDEAFYQRRVFFVNAKGALDARMARTNGPVLAGTAVPALEEALQTFLTDEQKLRATYRSTLEHLTRVHKEALTRIGARKSALRQPLDKLEGNEKRALNQLKNLSKRQEQIRKNILEEGYIVFNQLYGDLQEYAQLLNRDLQQQAIVVPGLHSRDLVAALGSVAKGQLLQKQVREAVNTYLHAKFETWLQSAQPRLQEKLKDFETRTRADIADFLADVADIRAQFSEIRLTDIDLEPGMVNMEYVAKAAAIGREDMAKTIAGSLRGLAAVLKVLGDSAVKVYAWLFPYAEKFFTIVDKGIRRIGIKFSFVETENKRHLDNFHKGLNMDVRDALTKDITERIEFTIGNIRDLRVLACRWSGSQDELSRYIWDQISPPDQKRLKEYADNEKLPETKELLELACKILNDRIKDSALYREERFVGVYLDDEIRRTLSDQHASPLNLNRWLLTRAYKQEIAEKLVDALYHRLTFEFHEIADEVLKPLEAYSGEVHEEINRIMREKRDQQPKVEAEIKRLEDIQAALEAVMRQVRDQVAQGGHSL